MIIGRKQTPLLSGTAAVIMVLFTLLTVGPLLWMLITALKPHKDIITNVFALPERLYLDNFARAWVVGKLGTFIVNSVFYSTFATLLTTLFGLMCGFAFTKIPFRLTRYLYSFFIVGLLLTVHSVLVPLFVLETRMGLDDTRIGVLLPYIAFGLPFAVFLAATYIQAIPSSVIEAGIIDGAGYMELFWRVIAPMSRPVAVTMLIFSFLANWNEFVLIMVLTSNDRIRSLPVGINSFASGMTRDFGILFAALVIGTVPMIVFYALFHKQIARGFAGSAVKE